LKAVIPFLVLLIGFASCSEQPVRVDLLTENGKEISFELAAEEEVTFYAEIEIAYQIKPLFVYHCSFYKDGVFMVEGGVDPLISKGKEEESFTVKDGVTHWKFRRKLEGNLMATTDGIYSIKTTFLKNKQADLKIMKANIVFTK
jgi:hypothetical protein